MNSRSFLCYNVRIMISYFRKYSRNTIIVIACLFLAGYMTNVHSENTFIFYLERCLVFTIYESLFAFWGLSIMRRIMNIRVRRYMLAADFAMAVWFVIRTLKWYIYTDPPAERILWYLYYVPQLALVYCAFAIGECTTQRDIVKLKRNRAFAFIPTLLLSAFVLTNEHHHLVFSVDPVTLKTGHVIGYYIIASWIVGMLLFTVFRLPKEDQDRNYDKRVLIPYAPLFLGLLYCGAIFYKEWKGYNVYLEFTAGFSFFSIAFFESLILTGMVPSNTDYDWCFNHSGVNARIIDKNGESIFVSAHARRLSKKELSQLITKSYVVSDENTELNSAHIRGGYVIWERDISEINASMQHLLETRESVREATQTLEENIEIEKKRKAISARNHLYDITFSNVSDKLQVLSKLIKEANGLSGEELTRTLRRIDLIGVYVKRKSNLLLLSEQTLKDFTGELKLCFKESFDNLNDADIEANYIFNRVSGLAYETADIIYMAFETMLEATLDGLKSISAILADQGSMCVLTVNAVGAAVDVPDDYFRKLSEKTGVFFEREGDAGDFTVSFFIMKGGLENADL